MIPINQESYYSRSQFDKKLGIFHKVYLISISIDMKNGFSQAFVLNRPQIFGFIIFFSCIYFKTPKKNLKIKSLHEAIISIILLKPNHAMQSLIL